LHYFLRIARPMVYLLLILKFFYIFGRIFNKKIE
jgi:hypothetical protein